MSRPGSIQHPNVRIGKNVVIEDFVIIGQPPVGADPGDIETVIGDNCRIRSHTVIYAGVVLGNGVQTGHHSLIREYCQIGYNSSVGSHTVVEHHVKMDENVRIHSQAFICEYSILKARSWVGPNVVFTNAKYPNYPGVKDHLKGVTLEEGAKIGANAALLPGVSIGQESLIGAGAVVTKSVPAHEIWVGNPAQKIKSSSEVNYQ